MFEYLQSLSVIHQALLSVAIGVGLSFSLRNYLAFWVGFYYNKAIKQSTYGKMIDWCWLSLVIYLTIALA